MKTPRSWTAGLLGLTVLLVVSSARAQEPDEDVREAVDALNAWLGDSDVGTGWRNYLRSEDLETELAKGRDADKEVIGEILTLYKSRVAGLKLSRFARVRETLEALLIDLELPAADELPEAVKRTVEDFKPLDETAAVLSGSRLQVARAELEQLLSRSPSDWEAGWKRYLRWDEMQESLAAEKPDGEVLQGIIARYFGAANGLDMSQFVKMRKAMIAHLNTLYALSDPDLKATYTQRMTELSALLTAHREAPSQKTADQIGEILGWLGRVKQADDIVALVHRHHSKPNMFLRMSDRLATSAFYRNVDDTNRVQDNVNGTTVVGDVTTKGKVRAKLFPSSGSASMRVNFNGVMNSDTTGYNGPVTIYSTGRTTFESYKWVQVNDRGLSKQHPARAKADARTQVNNVDGNSQVAIDTAWGRIRAGAAQRQQQASRRAEREIRNRLNREVGKQVDQANARFRKRLWMPLERHDSTPKLTRFDSSDDELTLKVVQLAPYRIAAPGRPPERTSTNDLNTRLHESMVANFSWSSVGGVTTTDKQLAEFMKENFRNVPDELASEEESERWSITFSSNPKMPPVLAVFTKGIVKLTIHGEAFTRGSQEIKTPVSISADYEPVVKDGELTLERKSDLNVKYIGGGRLGVSQLTFKTFLRRKFGSVMQETIVSDGIVLPEPWDKIGTMPWREAVVHEGWISAGWEMPAEAVAALPADDS